MSMQETCWDGAHTRIGMRCRDCGGWTPTFHGAVMKSYELTTRIKEANLALEKMRADFTMAIDCETGSWGENFSDKFYAVMHRLSGSQRLDGLPDDERCWPQDCDPDCPGPERPRKNE